MGGMVSSGGYERVGRASKAERNEYKALSVAEKLRRGEQILLEHPDLKESFVRDLFRENRWVVRLEIEALRKYQWGKRCPEKEYIPLDKYSKKQIAEIEEVYFKYYCGRPFMEIYEAFKLAMTPSMHHRMTDADRFYEGLYKRVLEFMENYAVNY